MANVENKPCGGLVFSSTHIPEPIVRRRYVAGINNLFQLFMNEVDLWDIYDNSQKPRIEVACGGKGVDPIIFNESLFKTIESYVK